MVFMQTYLLPWGICDKFIAC